MEMGKMREQLFRQMMGEQPKIDSGFVEFGSHAAAQLQAQQRQEDLQRQFHDETMTRWEKMLEGQSNGNRLLSSAKVYACVLGDVSQLPSMSGVEILDSHPELALNELLRCAT